VRALTRPSRRPDGVKRGADRSVFGRANEIKNLVHEWVGRKFRRDVVYPLRQGALVRKQKAVSAPDVVNLLVCEAAAAETDNVETGEMRAIADGHAVGNDVVFNR
jgi:hypothetical protein